MSCHLTNLFEWVGGWVGSSHISPYPSYIRCCCVEFEAPYPLQSQRSQGLTFVTGPSIVQLLYSKQTNVDRESMCMYLKQAFWKTRGEREEKKRKCVAELLNRLDTRYRSSTTPHTQHLRSVPLLALGNQGDDHSMDQTCMLISVFRPKILIWVNVPVEIVEEGQQIEPELDETLLLVSRQRPENFCCIVHVVFIADSVGMKYSHRR